MANRNITIAFLGGSIFGEIVREKLKAAGFRLVDSNSLQVDLIVVAFYGKILSKKELETPAYGALNVHPSLLPKYRGPTPVPTTILNGDTETGVTIIQMDEEIDHGPIVASKKFEIGNKKFTTPELRKILWELGGDLLVEVIPKWVTGKITPQEQEHDKATYTEKLTREDGEVDWSRPAVYIERQVRAFYPWPGTFTHVTYNSQHKTLKILEAGLLEQPKTGMFEKSGKTFLAPNGSIAVQTKQNALVIKQLQLEGGKSMSSQEFLLGHKDFIGIILS